MSEGKSLYHPFFHKACGISKVGDLVSKDNTFLGSGKILNAKLTPSQYFFLMGVVSAIPNEWRSTIKGKSVYCEPHPYTENYFQVPIGGQMIDLASISSKMVYKEFRSRKEIPPTAQAKFKDEYPERTLHRLEETLFISLQCYFGHKLKSFSIQIAKSYCFYK